MSDNLAQGFRASISFSVCCVRRAPSTAFRSKVRNRQYTDGISWRPPGASPFPRLYFHRGTASLWKSRTRMTFPHLRDTLLSRVSQRSGSA